MPARIVVFGATGYTGRLTSERLVAQGERPLLAGRSEERLTELAERLGGLEWRVADVDRPNTVFSLVERGDVVVSTVGPFVKWGDPAVRAAIAAPAVYLDSTGEPQFIRRVFDAFGPAAAGAGATLMTAMGYDFVPGALAGALALEERRRASGRCAWTSGTTRWAPARARSPAARGPRSSAPRWAAASPSATARCGPCARPSGCATSRSAASSGRRSRSAAPSTSGCRRPTRGSRRSTSISAGWDRWRAWHRPPRWAARSWGRSRASPHWPGWAASS